MIGGLFVDTLFEIDAMEYKSELRGKGWGSAGQFSRHLRERECGLCRCFLSATSSTMKPCAESLINILNYRYLYIECDGLKLTLLLSPERCQLCLDTFREERPLISPVYFG